jgi:7-cyano-7-deazaguanine synthase
MATAILLSGGIDSVALAFWKRPDYAITVDYGQASAETELRISQRVAAEFRIVHQFVRTQTRELGTGLLANTDQIPYAPTPEWWPFRNQFLITVGAMLAVKLGVTELMIGAVKSDTGHADSTPAFVRLLDELVSLQEGGVRVTAPAHHLTAEELVRKSKIPFALLAETHSCHTGNLACGSCRGCLKQIEILETFG